MVLDDQQELINQLLISYQQDFKSNKRGKKMRSFEDLLGDVGIRTAAMKEFIAHNPEQEGFNVGKPSELSQANKKILSTYMRETYLPEHYGAQNNECDDTICAQYMNQDKREKVYRDLAYKFVERTGSASGHPDFIREAGEDAIKETREYLSRGTIHLDDEGQDDDNRWGYRRPYWSYYEFEPDLEDFRDIYPDDYDSYTTLRNAFMERPSRAYINGIVHGELDYVEEYAHDGYVRSLFMSEFPEELEDDLALDWSCDTITDETPYGSQVIELICQYIDEHLSSHQVAEWLENNDAFSKHVEAEQQELREQQELEKLLPSNYVYMFPECRKLKRKFFIHSGPTNSGKTHDGIERLKNCENGVYLAPLRLLAYEIYEQLNDDGIPVALLTGEEEISNDNASVVCSTCEMADFSKRCDIAVIDEVQMIADADRGGAWTNAILGIQADEIHVCCSPDAESIVARLVSDCDDNFEIIRHERLTPLEYSGDSGYERGDAMIVFSRKKVHNLAGEMKDRGYNPSVIYGALPYMVRQNEARKFREGITDIVISTDAIGMGMNLPIRRVVLMEDEKFNGHEMAKLTSSETKQIVGRAGRYGIYDTGYYSTRASKNALKKKMKAAEKEIDSAVVSIPGVLTQSELPVSKILTHWNNMELADGYAKQQADEELIRAKIVEEYTDSAKDVWAFSLMSLNNGEECQFAHWNKILNAHYEGEEIALPASANMIESMNELEDLERLFKTLDVYYQYFDRFGNDEKKSEVMSAKERVSYRMMTLLEEYKFDKKTCRVCGKTLPFDHPYGMCEKCHDKMYPRRWDDWDDDDEWEYW